MKIFEKILGGNILYYPGCLTKFALGELKLKYEKILKDLGIDFIELSEIEKCCGSPVLSAGYFQDFKKISQDNFKIFKEHSVKKIITNCPGCFMIFKKYYSEALGNEWNIEVEHITQTIFKNFKKLKIKPSTSKEIVTFHDPCHLGRHMGIFEEPREIIKSLGYELVEMELSRNESFCCGGGGGVRTNEPELAKRIAKDRIKQAIKTKAKILITCCPLCYLNLKENTEEIEVKELSQLF